MKTHVALVAASLACASPARAHWLDQYLQATTILVGATRVNVQLRLTPGIAIAARVLSAIDIDHDGIVSPIEARAYAARVAHDVTLRIADVDTRLEIGAVTFPSLADLREGRGVITIDGTAPVPAGSATRAVTFENRHERAMSVYLVNALQPTDARIHIVEQRRTYDQSRYTLSYTQDGATLTAPVRAAGTGATPWWLAGATAVVVAFARSRKGATASSTVT